MVNQNRKLSSCYKTLRGGARDNLGWSNPCTGRSTTINYGFIKIFQAYCIFQEQSTFLKNFCLVMQITESETKVQITAEH